MASTPNPTAAYRKQQGLGAITQSTDPTVVSWIEKAAKATGADPNALLATAIQESGARRGEVGDNGTSFGPFQHHVGGALGTHPASWANTYGAVYERAQQFAQDQVHHGKGAAAVQRPLDRQLYATGVDSHMEQARRIILRDSHIALNDLSKKKATTKATAPTSSTPTGSEIPDDELLSALSSNAKIARLPGAGSMTGNPEQDALSMNAAIAGVQAPTLARMPTPAAGPVTSPTPAAPKATKVKKVKPAAAPLKPGGGWEGSQALADAMKRIGAMNGLKVISAKRATKLTTSGNPSDHWTGSKGSFAYDLSNGSAPTRQMDATAAHIAAALGAGAQWKKQGNAGVLNVNLNGYRYQMLYRTKVGGNHFNHVHIGVRKL